MKITSIKDAAKEYDFLDDRDKWASGVPFENSIAKLAFEAGAKWAVERAGEAITERLMRPEWRTSHYVQYTNQVLEHVLSDIKEVLK